MTSLNTQLWELIENHKMPDDAEGEPFVNQLMVENSISQDTALTAIEEYRKFMYLCATRTERNVPSKAVDLVWHLHMQHSRDYWNVFCKKLGKPVHHTPGSSGAQHLDDYNATVKAYSTLFGTPPKGIWKRIDRLNICINLIFSLCLMVFSIRIFNQDGQLPIIIGQSLLLFFFLKNLNDLTTKSEFTLVFESGDPFANDDAGHCGGADCGGCGD